MYDSVLVPTDGSAGTKETLSHAIALATDNDATLYVLSVIDKRIYLAADKEDQDDVLETLTEEAEAAVEEAAQTARDAGLEVVTEVRDGIPYREILRHVEDTGIDLVAIGTHGRTGRDRLANMGSVTERVVK
ncbi:MAG: universal stress protein, partial [Halobacteriales archaeon]|nr:universal stress protein [Halobacteriales archaeon]